MTESALRQAIVDTARAMNSSGLSPGRSGNVSARSRDGMLITPSGLAYAEMGPDDVVHVGPDGRVAKGQRAPSSEWHFHLAAYGARPDMNAVVHTHSLHATVLACAGHSIPAFHYMVAVAGGDDIPMVPYATFGTPELARHVAGGLRSRKACLLAHHGQVAMGPSLEAALELAHEVEILAEQYWKVRLLGGVKLLPKAEMARVLEKFKSYGRAAQPGLAKRGK
ncbi:MAG: class II aldolase/adducin family protein [Hyphomicrobium sp.]|jgi:L-fuculose-phosphate aldolase|nr:class II aldolase/adducin family protein [Hyphomicrobium sp.]